MQFNDAEISFPAIAPGATRSALVLIRGWGEAKKHFVWSLGCYERKQASRRWLDGNEDVLWFEPIAWAYLPGVTGTAEMLATDDKL
jgi:hypothetical protein